MRAAVIGIGSNSVRMLLADIHGTSAVRLRREREGTRLFAGLDAEGRLSMASMEKTVHAVTQMADSARKDGAEAVRLFATSATRDAANSDVFAALLREQAHVELEITPGETEAELSYLGATDGGFTGVIDIGGGSTELVIGKGLEVHCAFSCQMGAVRLFRQLPIACRADLGPVEHMAASLLEEQLALHPGLALPEKWIGTGGTFTTLAAMIRGLSWTERTFMHGTVLPLARIEQLAGDLADMPMEARLKLPGLQPNRADIVVHGICILLACMHRLGIQEITVSEYGNLDGYMKRTYRLTDGFTV